MPKKRRSTKSRIIKAAWSLFYKNGYDATTVEDIITASKTSKGTFYHYFKSKEGLLNTLSYLFDEKYEELQGTLDPSLTRNDFISNGCSRSCRTLLTAVNFPARPQPRNS